MEQLVGMTVPCRIRSTPLVYELPLVFVRLPANTAVLSALLCQLPRETHAITLWALSHWPFAQLSVALGLVQLPTLLDGRSSMLDERPST